MVKKLFYTLPEVLHNSFLSGRLEGFPKPEEIPNYGSITCQNCEYVWTNAVGDVTKGTLEGIIVEFLPQADGEGGVVFADDHSRNALFNRYDHLFRPL